MDNENFQIGNYTFSEQNMIGHGSYAKVYKATDHQGNSVAVKVFQNYSFQDQDSQESLRYEIQVMKELHSQHVVQLIDLFVDEYRTYLVMELCENGDLRDYLNKTGTLDELQAINILKQIATGIKELTDNGYIHRDIKPENILIHNDKFKLADFGFATKLNIHSPETLKQQIGTPMYMSPQVLEDNEYTSKCDIWSVGLIFYEILFGKTPWPCRDMNSYKENIKQFPNIKFPYDKPISKLTKNLIISALQYEENQRISWDEFYEHPIIALQTHQELIFQQQKTISQEVQQLLEQIQSMIQLKHINLQLFFNQYPNQIDIKLAYNLFTSFDNRINNYDVKQLFLELAENGYIQKSQIIKLLSRIDFGNSTDIFGRIISDLQETIKHNHIDLQAIFKHFDKGNQGKLRFPDFLLLIRYIAPKIKNFELEGLFSYLDESQVGEIDFQQLQKKLSYAIPNQINNYYEPLTEKRKRILNELRRIILQNDLEIEKVFNNFDKDHNKALNLEEFYSLIQIIDSSAHEEDVVALFNDFNVRKNGQISIEEFKNEINDK